MSRVKPINICLVAEEYPEETGWGGIGTYHYNVAHGYAAHGCNVVVIARALKYETVVSQGRIHVFRIKPLLSDLPIFSELMGYRLAVMKKLQEISETLKIDLIESPEWKAETFFYNLLDGRIPIALRLHSTLSLIARFNELGALTVEQKLQDECERFLLSRVKIISSSSKALIPLLNCSDRIKKKIPAIRNPANNVDFRPGVKPSNYFRRLPKGSTVILYVGRIERRKGVNLLIEALARLLNRNKKLHLVLVGRDTFTGRGGGSFQQEILKSLESSHRRHCHFVGYVPYKQLPAYYAGANIVVIPSLFDNFPAVCLEAMASGKAVVAGKHGGMSEMIKDGESGLLFDPFLNNDLYTKLSYLTETEAFRDRVGKNARIRIDTHYDRIKVSEQLLKFYRNSLKKLSRAQLSRPNPTTVAFHSTA